MTRLNVKPWKISRLGGTHRFVAFVAAIGLFLQSYATQTHIHFESREIGGFFQTAGHTPSSKQSPLDKAAACPLCQAIVHAGAFVVPSAPLVYLSFSWVAAARLTFAAPPASGPVAHGWQSRAPPRG